MSGTVAPLEKTISLIGYCCNWCASSILIYMLKDITRERSIRCRSIGNSIDIWDYTISTASIIEDLYLFWRECTIPQCNFIYDTIKITISSHFPYIEWICGCEEGSWYRQDIFQNIIYIDFEQSTIIGPYNMIPGIYLGFCKTLYSIRSFWGYYCEFKSTIELIMLKTILIIPVFIEYGCSV